jgi:hypothetical protein
LRKITESMNIKMIKTIEQCTVNEGLFKTTFKVYMVAS